MSAAVAQNSQNLEYYKDSTMVQRWDSATQKAIAATQANQPGKRKKKKTDAILRNEFQGKAFEGGGGNFGKKLSGQKDFAFDQKVSSGSFGTRSFFGLKNPWFGKKVAPTSTASLWSKTAVANADKAFPLESAETREYYQADKKAAEREAPVPTRAISVEGSAQGSVGLSSRKDMTIEEVRHLLNKGS